MANDEVYQKLVGVGISYVSFRPRSEKEIRTFLQGKLSKWNSELTDTPLEKAVDRLRELGYVDDEKFVDWWIDQRTSLRPKGARLIAQELRQKGVAREIYEQKLDGSNETERARVLVVKKASRWGKLSPLDKKKKIYNFLGSRGFSGETIHRVIDEKE